MGIRVSDDGRGGGLLNLNVIFLSRFSIRKIGGGNGSSSGGDIIISVL